MGNHIEPATTSRSKCVTCNQVIDKGTPRMAEEYSDIGIPKLIMRFYHLRCAAAAHPELLRRALEDVRSGCEFDRAELEARIAARLQHEDDQRRERYEAKLAERAVARPVVATDGTSAELIAQLAEDPDDPGTLAVVADQLQARGDPRGELIAVQLALAAQGKRLRIRGDDDDDDDDDDPVDVEALARRREALMTQLALPVALDQHDRIAWGTGFIRRLELVGKTGTRLTALEPIWGHPSMRLLGELRLTFTAIHDPSWLATLATHIAPTLRSLELATSSDNVLVELPALLAAQPRLRSLGVLGRFDAAALEHPRLARLALGRPSRAGELHPTLASLSRERLPSLVELSLTGFSPHEWNDQTAERERRAEDFDPICTSLRPWLARLTHLALLDGTLGADGLAALIDGLAGRKLRRLDLTGTPMPLSARTRLVALCDELVLPDVIGAADAELWVEHAKKPEWGRGRIVRRFDGKLEIEFPNAGSKVFKADAPFLRLGS